MANRQYVRIHIADHARHRGRAGHTGGRACGFASRAIEESVLDRKFNGAVGGESLVPETACGELPN